MINDQKIAASILSADFAKLGEESASVINAGADMIHFDVMDNHFVSNLTIGAVGCKALRDFGITAAIDVHLMVQPVDNLIKMFANAGATYITIHAEATDNIEKNLQLITDSGCRAGLAFNPDTPLDQLDAVLEKLDMVLIMSVHPGFGGQGFIESSLEKISHARKMIDGSGKDIRLEVDGGIKVHNIKAVADAGADTFVAGSAIFNTGDYATTIAAFRAALLG